MLTKEEREKYESLQKHIKSLPNLHLTIKQEKRLIAKNLEKREELQKEIKARIAKEEETVWFNSLKKRIKKSEITTSMLEVEEEFSEYLISNDNK